jgi:beta-xylosidase
MDNKGKNALLLSALLFLAAFTSAQNPFITDSYAADPSAHVFNGRVYVYPSHDRDSAKTFDMKDYHVYSSKNMKDWTDHGVVLTLDSISWAKEKAWAPDCNYRNGKYYFYFPTDESQIGVAVGDSPAGPFKDALGKPLITKDSPGVVNKRHFIDPAIFIDDDGTPYLFMGQLDVNVIKLNDDMISYDGPVHIIEGAKDFFEGIWVHKYNGTYYLSYSTWGEEGVTGPQIVYATSNNVLGPYEYQGVILDEVNSGTNHHSIVEYEGQWYLFYHDSDLYFKRHPEEKSKFGWKHPGRHPYRRSINIDYLYYKNDGTIKQVFPTDEGVEPVNNTNK